MEDEEKVEPEYLKGFNEGYIMAKHSPELAEKLANINSDFIRLVAFKEGRQQFQMEQTKDRRPDWLKNDRFAKDKGTSTPTRDRDIEPDKG